MYTEDCYPYLGEKNTCSEGINAKIKVTDYVKVPANEQILKEAVGEYINSEISFTNYSLGGEPMWK